MSWDAGQGSGVHVQLLFAGLATAGGPFFVWLVDREDTKKQQKAALSVTEETNHGLEIKMHPEREIPRGAASQRAVRLGAFVENVDTGTVLNRDDWRCGLCGTEIDPKLRHPNRRAGTIDHIIPLSQGGQHHYGNVQAAHYSCNSAKGNRTRPEDLAKYKRMNGDAV